MMSGSTTNSQKHAEVIEQKWVNTKYFLEIAYKGDQCYATKIKEIKAISHQPTKCSWLTILSGTAPVVCTGWAREKGIRKNNTMYTNLYVKTQNAHLPKNCSKTFAARARKSDCILSSTLDI